MRIRQIKWIGYNVASGKRRKKKVPGLKFSSRAHGAITK